MNTPSDTPSILLFDVMSTLVTDPIFKEIPDFLGLTLAELYRSKSSESSRSAWPDFERGEIDEEEYARRFFPDDRILDVHGMKAAMRHAYGWIDGMEDLLADLKAKEQPMYVLSNYPFWYQMIEEALHLSRYLPWRFVSCHMGVRKPEQEIFRRAASELAVPPAACVFIDDREDNVSGAQSIGMAGIRFTDAASLRNSLEAMSFL